MYHKPVLLKEVLKYWVDPLLVKKRKKIVLVDATCGEGGHSLALLQKAEKEGWLKKLKLICLDWDGDILKIAKKRLAKYNSQVIFINSSYVALDRVLCRLGVGKIDGILFDFGASTYHFKKAKKGFSFQDKSLLDMRYSKETKDTAFEVVNEYPEEKIAEILKIYGEERWAKKIAQNIVKARLNGKIQTAQELTKIVLQSIPRRFWGRLNPATKTFQALRVYINKELENVRRGILEAVSFLAPQGRILAITYHSLEDRIVKRIFRLKTQPKRDIVYGRVLRQGSLKSFPALCPSKNEVQKNPSSRSAKMRVAERRREVYEANGHGRRE